MLTARPGSARSKSIRAACRAAGIPEEVLGLGIAVRRDGGKAPRGPGQARGVVADEPGVFRCEQPARPRDVLFGPRGDAPGSGDRRGHAGTVQAAQQRSGLAVDLRLVGLGDVRATGDPAGQCRDQDGAQARVRGQEPGSAASAQGRRPPAVGGHLALMKPL